MATANTRWTNGAGTGNWGTAANWSHGVPDGTWGASFDESNTDDVIAGLNQTGVDTPFIHRLEGYTGDIGQQGNPLIISTGLLWLEGSGFFNFQNGNGTTDQVVVDAFNMGSPGILDGDITRLWVLKGEALTGTSFGTSGNNALVYVGTRGGIQDAKLTIGTLGGALSLIIQKAGYISYQDKVQTHGVLQLDGGRFLLHADTGFNGDVRQTGGRFIGQNVVTISEYMQTGGVADFTIDGDKKNITDLWRLPGTTFLENNNMNITNDNSPIPIN